MTRSTLLRTAPLLLALASPLAAQEAPRTLTLAEALRIAEENNPGYRKALSELPAAAADRRRAGGAFLPSLGISYGTGAQISRTFTGIDEFGQPVTRDEASTNTRSSTSQGLTLGSITLWDWGARMRELRAARANESAAHAGVDAEANRMAGELARRYWNAVRTERAILLEERLLAGAKERLDATRRLLRVAAAGPVDVLGGEVEVAQQEQAVERARGDLRKAELALREQMGVLDDRPLRLVDEPPAPFDPATLDAAALVRRATDAAPEVRRGEARAVAAEHRVRAARARRWPTIGADAGFSRSQGQSDYRGLFDPNPLDQSFNVGLRVAFPIFDQWQSAAAVAQSRAGAEAARQDVRAARLSAEREARGALIDLDNTYRAVRSAERAVSLARQRLELAQQQYRLGSLAFVALQSAVESAARAERDALTARFDFAAALATLQERTGGAARP